jgi:hypothetical protein
MGAWLAANYAVEVKRRLAEVKDGKERFAVMRAFVRDWAWMRARGQAQARVEMQQFRAAVFEREYFEGAKEKMRRAELLKQVIEKQKAERERERSEANTEEGGGI